MDIIFGMYRKFGLHNASTSGILTNDLLFKDFFMDNGLLGAQSCFTVLKEKLNYQTKSDISNIIKKLRGPTPITSDLQFFKLPWSYEDNEMATFHYLCKFTYRAFCDSKKMAGS